MRDRSTFISKLLGEKKARAAYIKAKLGVLVPSQIRALRIKSDMPRQSDLAEAAGMQQSRISMFETPGAANVTLETLAWLAAIFKVGVVVKFVPFSEMLRWENTFSQDDFTVTKIDSDREFLQPSLVALASEQIDSRAKTGMFIGYPQRNLGLGTAAATAYHGLTYGGLIEVPPFPRETPRHWGAVMQQTNQSHGGAYNESSQYRGGPCREAVSHGGN